MEIEIREQRTENREQRTENREQRTENREQRTENREQRASAKCAGVMEVLLFSVCTRFFRWCPFTKRYEREECAGPRSARRGKTNYQQTDTNGRNGVNGTTSIIREHSRRICVHSRLCFDEARGEDDPGRGKQSTQHRLLSHETRRLRRRTSPLDDRRGRRPRVVEATELAIRIVDEHVRNPQ
jgi:hypothetical protein